MKKTAFLLFLILTVGVSTLSQAQENVSRYEYTARDDFKTRPFRIGIKLGLPNGVGGNVEYVTPLLKKKLALNIDYSVIKSEWVQMEEDLDFNYLEGGLNYYFFKPGKGLYGGISYGKLKIEEEIVETGYREITNFSNDSWNVKLGAKLGGIFYFRPEVGYSFNPLPNSYEVEKIYADGRREKIEEEFDLPGADILFKGLMANIGFGFAF